MQWSYSAIHGTMSLLGKYISKLKLKVILSKIPCMLIYFWHKSLYMNTGRDIFQFLCLFWRTSLKIKSTVKTTKILLSERVFRTAKLWKCFKILTWENCLGRADKEALKTVIFHRMNFNFLTLYSKTKNNSLLWIIGRTEKTGQEIAYLWFC